MLLLSIGEPVDPGRRDSAHTDCHACIGMDDWRLSDGQLVDINTVSK